MVVCNIDRFLAKAIKSILHQTFGEFEFIIVDFGSTDKSKAIVSSYAAKDSRIKLHG
jgi:glycosyltransferase involved in cell wall biosynthesis